MKIDDLDESQGMTREMVDHYLNRNGWCNMPDPDQRLLKPQYAHVSFKMGLGAAIERIAAIVGSTPQAILREINPRMRKGMPSEAARDAHDGFWLAIPDFACMGAHAPIVVTFDGDGFGIWHPEGFAFPNSKPKTAHFWHFWPCDEHGNKVRWPTDAAGKML